MIKTSERVWSLGGMAVGPVAAVGEGGTDVGVRTAVALGALVAGGATVADGEAAAAVAAATVAVACGATGGDAPCCLALPRHPHAARPLVRPFCTTLPVACSLARQTGFRKLIFSSSVVNDSPSARVLAYAMPIAASATSHSTPPCSVPIGLVW